MSDPQFPILVGNKGDPDARSYLLSSERRNHARWYLPGTGHYTDPVSGKKFSWKEVVIPSGEVPITMGK